MAENVTEEVEGVADKAKNALSGNGSGSLAKKLIVPAAAGVGTLVAGYAAKKGPDLWRGQVLPKLEDKGSDEAASIGTQAAEKMKGQAGLAGKVASSMTGGGSSSSSKKTRRLPIQRWTDVAVPVETAYKAWLDFEKFPKFMHRVLSVEKKSDKRLTWSEKIWFSKRQWEGEITERRANDRIAWKTKSGPEHSGVVSFHKLDDNLTRVMVTVDFHPTGMIEKMASGLRFVKRAVQSDLARFKAYVELEDAKGLGYGNPRANESDEKGESESSDSSSNGSGNGAKSSKEIEESRQERAERREQRRH
jgi:uncharacterized membrane protein